MLLARVVLKYGSLIKFLIFFFFIWFLTLLLLNSAAHDYISKRNKGLMEKERQENEIDRLKEIELRNLLESNRKLKEQRNLEQLKVFNEAKVIDDKNLEFFKLIQRRKYSEIDCRLVIEWDENEIRKAKRLLYQLKNHGNLYRKDIPLLHDSNFIFDRSMCRYYRSIRGYESYPTTKFEEEFPIAFSILAYNNVEQFERLLRIIYRPQNAYCIHIDSKSPAHFKQAIHSITDCFPNVFISTRSERIIYASFNRLQADLNCMHDLVQPNYSHPNLVGKQFNPGWNYLLNLAHTEFPLRTNYELVRILSLFNGANDIEVITNFTKDRIDYRWIIKRNMTNNEDYLFKTDIIKGPVPHNYKIVKGITYCSFSRRFVEYALFDRYAQNLLEWSKDTYSPDEWYWATLQYNINFNPPGGFNDPKRISVPSRARFIGWKNKYKCMGRYRNNICVFSLDDLPQMINKPDFFLNKFQLEFDPISYQCMEEWMHGKIQMYQTIKLVDYCKLPFVKQYSLNPRCANAMLKK